MLKDKTTGRNIFWACDRYVEKYVEDYRAEHEILPYQLTPTDLITEKLTKLIQSRMKKSQEEQKNRMRKRVEVFAPSWLCNEMNNNCDEEWFIWKNAFNTTI